jgi:hypothetical protein
MKLNRPPGWRILRQAIYAIDIILRRRHHVYEFDPSPKCVLRVAVQTAKEDRILRDGTTVRRGDLIAEIHYHNENIAAMGGPGPDKGWGLRYYARLRNSLRSLARHLSETPECQQVVAVWAEISYSGAEGADRYREYFERLGFDFVNTPPSHGFTRIEEFFLSLYVWALIWATNPDSLRGRPLRTAERAHLWMSRAEMMHHYDVTVGGPACCADADRVERTGRPEPGQIPADAH